MAQRRLLRDVEVGDYVKEAYGDDDKLLVSQFLISEQTDLDRLEEIGVTHCTVQDEPQPSDEDADEPGDPDDALKASEILDEELENLPDLVQKTEETYHQTVDKMEELVESVHGGKTSPSDLRQLEPYVGKFMDFVEESPASVSVLTQIERFDQSTFNHSVNVSILTLVYGHYKGFTDQELSKLGFGALLHDIGKTRLSRKIIQKEGELTDKEWEIVKQHPEKGRNVLKDAGFDESTQKIALQHHEHPSGTGYPEENSDIHPYSRIVSVIDVYEALTAARPYRGPMNPIRAYTVLKEEFYHHDETRDIVEDLIQCMGLFPVGCVVKLTNDDIAVVLENHPEHLKYPLVRVIARVDQGEIDDPYDVDLHHVQNQKQVIGDRIYDDEVEVARVLEYSNVPQLREAITEFIQQKKSRV